MRDFSKTWHLAISCSIQSVPYLKKCSFIYPTIVIWSSISYEWEWVSLNHGKNLLKWNTHVVAAPNSGNKTQFTVLACVNAAENSLATSYVTFDRETFSFLCNWLNTFPIISQNFGNKSLCGSINHRTLLPKHGCFLFHCMLVKDICSSMNCFSHWCCLIKVDIHIGLHDLVIIFESYGFMGGRNSEDPGC